MTTIVIPVYNEGENIRTALAALDANVSVPAEVWLVYDRPDDTTLQAARACATRLTVRLVPNKYGRGALNAIKTGLEDAPGEYVVVTMADLCDPPEVINDLVATATRTGADIVCASRYMKGGSQTGGPRLKGFLSRAAGWLLHTCAGLPVHDATNSFKLYRKSFLARTPIESTGGFELGIELVVKCRAQGGRLAEVPTAWRDRVAGASHFRLWQWLPHYLRWFFYAFRHRRAPRPEVSIVLLTWNRAPILPLCLEALYANLAPDVTREILIWDNASTDGTRDILAPYAARPDTRIFFSEKNLRLAAYKKLFDRARGRIIIELDDDVRALPPAFDRTLRDYMDAYRDYGFLALNPIQNEKTDGAKPAHFKYVDDVRGDKAVEEGCAGGWCAAFRRRDYWLVRPLTWFFSFRFNRPEDYVLTGLFRRVLRRRDGLIKYARCLHACGPIYAREAGLLAREIEKYEAGDCPAQAEAARRAGAEQ